MGGWRIRGRATLTAAAVGAAVMAVTLSGCWLQPGYDAERSAFNPIDNAITPANVGTLHTRWTVPLGAAVHDPVVSTNGVYATLGAYPGAGTVTLRALADGSARWTSPLFPAGNPYFSQDPTLFGNVVLVPVASSTTIGGFHSSIDQFDAASGAAGTPITEDISSQAITRGTKIVGTWASCTDTLLCASSLFVHDTSGPGSWKTLLDVTNGGAPYVTSPAVGTDDLFIGRGTSVQSFPLAPPSNCAQPGPNQVCPPVWSTNVVMQVAGNPVLSSDDKTVYVAAGTNLVALDAQTGTQLWSATLDAAASAAPAVNNASVYVPLANGELEVFASSCGAATCSPAWSANTTSRIGQQPAVTSGGVVYTASADGVVRAYAAAGCGKATCASLWSAATGSTITGGPVAALGGVFVGTSDGHLIAYSN
ncbi:MAG: PQQ-binding-like beta-propeller repeat protein [Actinobacteria bacterium]|nr:PQQ-binding-like beta-propeller repeat protein [Actinomycetota bacterium]